MTAATPEATPTVPPGYKQTEVGIIPQDWEVTDLGSICAMKSGEGITSKSIDDSSPYPCYGGNGLRGFTKTYTHDGLYALVGRQGALCGNVVGAEGRFFASEHAVVVSTRHGQCIQWLTHVLGCMNLNQHSESSAQPGLSVSKVLKLTLALPPTRAEQEAIAGALSDADAWIESLEKLIDKKRAIKQGAMQALLTPPGQPGHQRLPGFKGEWEVKRLEEIAEIQRGASPRPIDDPIWFDNSSEIGWVRISDVTNSGMHLRATTQKLSPAGIRNSRPVSRGNLIMSICATVGRPIILDIDACIHDGFVVFERLQVEQMFLFYVLKELENRWSDFGQTGSQMNLNTSLIRMTPISIPPTTAEQSAIAAVLSDMDAEIEAVEAKLAKARQVKQGMMQELLTGRIRLV